MRLFFAQKNKHDAWRIMCAENGFERDVCGAINEPVAREQCAILNRRPPPPNPIEETE